MSARSDRRRSGRAASDTRTNAQVMATVSANHVTSPTSLDIHVNGTMSGANAGRYLNW